MYICTCTYMYIYVYYWKSHHYRRQSCIHTVWYRTTVTEVSVHLSHWKFTWYTLHKPVLSQLCMEGIQSPCRLLPQSRTMLHLHFWCLHAPCQGFDRRIQTYCTSFYGVQSLVSHCTLVSRRRGRWAFLVSLIHMVCRRISSTVSLHISVFLIKSYCYE